MERIDLYDRYINNQLSDKERDEFDCRFGSGILIVSIKAVIRRIGFSDFTPSLALFILRNLVAQ